MKTFAKSLLRRDPDSTWQPISTAPNGTLAPDEPHPAGRDALAWVKNYLVKDIVNPHMLLEAFASASIEGNRLAEICGETLRRILAGLPVSDRYCLGLAWTLKEMEERGA